MVDMKFVFNNVLSIADMQIVLNYVLSIDDMQIILIMYCLDCILSIILSLKKNVIC